MTAVEIVVIVFGLYLGYWIVSKLIGGDGRPKIKNEDRADDNERPSAPASAEPTWHEVLGVSRDATVDELRAAYQTQIGRYHPDKVATMGDEIREVAERRTKALNAAYRQALRERGLA